MNDIKHRVMIVDDSPEVIHMLLEELREEFIVSAALSAEEAFQLLEENELPELILLDVNMPGMDGYEACEKIKNDHQLSEIDVVFLSANDTTEEIIRGLEAGAVDYIVKPHDPDVLRTKMTRVFEGRKKREMLKANADAATKLVQTVMSESGSLSTVVGFLRNSFSAVSNTELMETLLDAFRQFGLEAVVYWSVGNIKEAESTEGMPSMLELELVERMFGCGERFIEKGEKIFIMQKSVVVLIHNMPLDSEKRGSLKDTVQILLEGANSKLDAFANRDAEAARKMKIISDTVLNAKTGLGEVMRMQEHYKNQSVEIMDNMLEDMKEAFLTMGLTEAQEDELMKIMTSASDKALDHIDSGMEIDEEFKMIIGRLSDAAHQVIH